MQETHELLLKSSIFSRLQEEEAKTLAGYCESLTLQDGETIFTEGEAARSLYIIRTGKVLIRKKNTDGTEMDLARLIPGEHFGDFEMFEEIHRQATAVAETGTELLVFPRRTEAFRTILDRHPEIGARVLYELLSLVASRIRSANKLISERTPWIEDLRRQVLMDRLTGLYNRTWLADELPGLLSRTSGSVCVIAVKPDNFKPINDTWGHSAGDGVLKLIAEQAHSRIRPSDLAVRYRGDEYLLVLPGTNLSTARRIAGRLKRSFEAIDVGAFTEGAAYRLSFSLGVTVYPAEARTAPELVAIAFELMLRAREAGGSRICYGRKPEEAKTAEVPA